MSLLTLSKRILGKNEKTAPVKKKKISAAATVAKKNKQTVDAHALTTGRIGMVELVSEKGIKQQIHNTMVFTVLPHVTKTQIAAAISSRFGVKVKSVRTALSHPKTRRRGNTEGKTNLVKKAYVTVDNVQSLVNKK
ncbi:MAG: 50S ribosomal protein L23 [Patescibacteria group bacterium]